MWGNACYTYWLIFLVQDNIISFYLLISSYTLSHCKHHPKDRILKAHGTSGEIWNLRRWRLVGGSDVSHKDVAVKRILGTLSSSCFLAITGRAIFFNIFSFIPGPKQQNQMSTDWKCELKSISCLTLFYSDIFDTAMENKHRYNVAFLAVRAYIMFIFVFFSTQNVS